MNLHITNLIAKFHETLIFPRRTKILADLISNLLPRGATILDVGCGDGTIDALIMIKRPDIKITGIDIMRRERSVIPVTLYDGKTFPFPNEYFDTVIFIDTLHHTDNPQELLKEARRVIRRNIIIKDHYVTSQLSFLILQLMDWVGNRFYDVNLPYNYLSREQWNGLFKELQLTKVKEVTELNLYSFPFHYIFERNLHFLVELTLGRPFNH